MKNFLNPIFDINRETLFYLIDVVYPDIGMTFYNKE